MRYSVANISMSKNESKSQLFGDNAYATLIMDMGLIFAGFVPTNPVMDWVPTFAVFAPMTSFTVRTMARVLMPATSAPTTPPTGDFGIHPPMGVVSAPTTRCMDYTIIPDRMHATFVLTTHCMEFIIRQRPTPADCA